MAIRGPLASTHFPNSAPENPSIMRAIEVDPSDLGDRPIDSLPGVGQTDQARQGFVEDVEAVDFANAHVHGDGGGWDEPPVEARPGHGGSA